MSKKKPTSMGKNPTGTATSPIDSKQTAQGAQQGGPDPAGGNFAESLASTHLEYVRGADPVGTVPPPTTLKGAARAFVDMLQARKTTVFIDKLGERLAFERTGTRLYELLLIKHELLGSWPGGPTEGQLRKFHDQELAHYHMLARAMEQMGADPTAMTPCADVVAVEAQGLQHVLADPRTTLDQALHAILVAELADNDGWAMLIELAEGFGQSKLAQQFRSAKREEDEHLRHVRGWLDAFTKAEAGTA